MAHLLHRVTGLLIVVYLFLHIGAMSYTYFDAESGFDDLMATFASTPFLIADLVLFAGVMIHSLNGDEPPHLHARWYGRTETTWDLPPSQRCGGSLPMTGTTTPRKDWRW